MSHCPYWGVFAITSSAMHRNVMLMRSRHSAGPSADVGSIDRSSDGAFCIWPIALLRGQEPGVGVFGGDVGRRGRLARLPLPQRAHVAVLREQIAERGGPGAGEAEPDEHGLDLLVVDLRVPAVPVLDLQAAGEERQDLSRECGVTVDVQIGVLVDRSHEHAQRFEHRIALGTKVARPCAVDRAREQFVDVHGNPPAAVRHTTPGAKACVTLRCRLTTG